MLTLRRLRWIGGAFTVLLVALMADAAPVSIFINANLGASSDGTGASAAVSLDFESTAVSDFLTISIANTTPVETGSLLTAFGLELPASLSLSPTFATSVAGDYFDTLTFDHSVSPSWLDAPGGYDLMITSDGNFLGGNPNGAPAAGATQVITLNLGITGRSPSELESTFREFYAGDAANGSYAIARFQAVGPDGEGSDKVTGVVPEPATLVLLGLGAIAFRRRS